MVPLVKCGRHFKGWVGVDGLDIAHLQRNLWVVVLYVVQLVLVKVRVSYPDNIRESFPVSLEDVKDFAVHHPFSYSQVVCRIKDTVRYFGYCVTTGERIAHLSIRYLYVISRAA